MTSNQAEHILRALYAKHNPEKKRDIEGLLIKYRNNEQELINSVFRKYGVSQEEQTQYLNFDTDSEAYNPNYRSRIIIVILILTVITVIILLLVNKRETSTQQDSMNKIEEQMNDPSVVRNTDSLKAEKEWPLFYKKFKAAIATKNKGVIAEMTAKDFSDGGGGETIQEWMNNVLFAYDDSYQSFRSMLDTASYKVEMANGRVHEKTGQYIYFEYNNSRWEFAGIIGD